ncbi:DUF4340 domain-containing protein [Prosthecobacter sp.]|uniref:DUF4340 domain-containing protein n=1 Tax=Prosthecobacter sp. TaxID=1965333 RepID=UPI00378475BF
MKKILILLVLLTAIIGIAVFKGKERTTRLNRATTTVKMRELLFPETEKDGKTEGFDINGIRKIHIKDDKAEITLTVQNDTWVCQERGGYPVEKEKLQTALMSLKYEKVKAARRVGKDTWGKLGLKESGEGAGTFVELFDDKGAVKYSFVLGGQVTSSGGGSENDQMKMFGGGPKGNRFVRLIGDDTIYEIADQLPDLVTKPSDWLAKTFIDVQKLKSVEVTDAKPEDSWKASRAEETAEFALEGGKPTEKIDAAKVSLGSLLSTPTFNDVLAKDKAATLMKDAVKAKLVTFEGFTYDVQAAKQAGQGGGDKYYLTVNVSADIPKERAPVKDEKPEDKKKNDDAFAEEKKKKEEKLANEKACEGWVYEVSEYTVSSLLKKRHEILAMPDMKGTPPEGAVPGKPAGLPDVKKMIPGLNMVAPPGAPAMPAAPSAPSISNPPPPVPAAPKVELKPAPAPDAAPAPAPAPATGDKPAAAAPAPATATTPPVSAPPAAPAKPEAEKKP